MENKNQKSVKTGASGVSTETQTKFTPEEVVSKYLRACNEEMFKQGLIPNESFGYMIDTMRDFQKNLEKNNMMIVIQEVK